MQFFKLQYFAEGGGEGGAPAATGAQTEGITGTNEQSEQKDAEALRRSDYESKIKGEYKDYYKQDVEKAIKSRFKDHDALVKKAARVDEYTPLMSMLAEKYGIADAEDIKAVMTALENDESFYEEEAMREGLTVEQLKRFKQLERDSKAYQHLLYQNDIEDKARETYSKWVNEAESVKALYPDFDLDAEVNAEETGERFINLLSKGVDVKQAYELIHMDELMSGAMQKTANVVREQTFNEIRTRGMRPSENGGAGNAAAKTGALDPAKMTKAERDKIARRARNGERITFRE